MAIEHIDETQERRPVPRQGRIRRCSVRHVSIVAGGELPTVQVDCLLGGREYPLPLGTMDEARPICNARRRGLAAAPLSGPHDGVSL